MVRSFNVSFFIRNIGKFRNGERPTEGCKNHWQDKYMTDPQQFLFYQSEDGSTRIDVMLEAETLWLNQKQLTDLFDKAKGTISEHIKHIFEEDELVENSVVRLFRTTAADGKQYEVAHYNLDMVLVLRFRQWANDRLKEYIVKDFVLINNMTTGFAHGI
jgi:hypothetical protein